MEPFSSYKPTNKHYFSGAVGGRMDRPTRPSLRPSDGLVGTVPGVEYVEDEEEADWATDRIDERRGDAADGGGDQGGEGAERAEGCTHGHAAAVQWAVVSGASTEGYSLRGAGRPRLTEDAERLVLARYFYQTRDLFEA